MKRLALACMPLLVGACSAAEDRPPPEAGPPAAAAVRSVPGPLDSLIAEGEVRYRRGEFDSARVVWNAVLASAGDDARAQGQTLTWLGLAAFRQGDFEEALRVGEQALEVKLEHGLAGELWRSYNALGLLAWHEGRLVDAEALFQRALNSGRDLENDTAATAASNNLALVQTDLGDFARAEANLQAALEGGRRLGSAVLEISALSNLGMLDIWRGTPDAAVPRLREARAMAAREELPIQEQNTLGQLGSALLALGRPEEAMAMLDTALALARRHGLPQEEASDLELMGDLYRDLGSSEHAFRSYAAARAIYEELALEVEHGSLLRKEAGLHAELGSLERARTSALAALERHRRLGVAAEELDDLLVLAEIAARTDTASDLPDRLAEADRLAAQLGTPAARTAAALSRARVADRRGEPRRTLASIAALDTALALVPDAVAWEAHALRARAWGALDSLPAALREGGSAIASLERIRAEVPSSPLRSSFMAARAHVYADHVLTLLRAGRATEAFEVADGARGRALLEHLAGRREAAAQEPAEDLAEGERLLRSIDQLLAQLAESGPPPEGERGGTAAADPGVIGRLREARAAYEAALHRARRRDPGAVALLGGRSTRFEEVKAALAPDEALVEFLVAPEELVVFVLTSQGVRTHHRSVPAADLGSRVRLARELLGRPTSRREQFGPVLQGLHRELVSEAVGGLPSRVRNLVIVPHAMLSYLPFTALMDPVSGRYLGERFGVAVLPSAAALPAVRRLTTEEDPPASRASVLVPFPDDLPATAPEARQVHAMLPNARLRSAAAASEAMLRQALREDDVVHVATHAAMNARNPLFSQIQLSRGPQANGDPDDDGRLHVHELLDLPIRSSFVFLSGCETAVGGSWATDFLRREDFATLAQGFLAAGARGVVATLWRIEDQGAAAFAERFYSRLPGRSLADALALAQAAQRADPRFAHPYHWAGHVLTGDGLHRVLPQTEIVASVR